jgi:thymidylate synthase (FAD)
MEALRRMLKGETVTREDVGMSAGEWREFELNFGPGE